MNKHIFYAFIFLTSFFTTDSIAFAHPGRTDSSGCHTCRTNCANWGLSSGEYHCHNAKSVPQSIEPVKSTYGESGTGYTTPAPEYKKPIQPVKQSSSEIKKNIPPAKKSTVEVKNATTKSSTTTDNIPLSLSVKSIVPDQAVVKKTSWFSRFFSLFR